jgi:hypothetical protein
MAGVPRDPAGDDADDARIEVIRRPGSGMAWVLARGDGIRAVDLGLRVPESWDRPDAVVPDWPWRWLGQMAELAASRPDWFVDLGVVPNGDPPEPLDPGCPFAGWLLVEVEPATDGDAGRIPLLELVPLTVDELVLARVASPAALADLLADAAVLGAPLDPERGSPLAAMAAAGDAGGPAADGLLEAVAAALRETRATLARRQERMGSLALLRGRIAPPAWLSTDDEDPLHLIYADQWILRRYGQVVWSHVAEANDLLGSDDGDDHPATVVWSLDPWFDRAVDDLRRIAEAVRDPPRAARPDSETARFARQAAAHVGRIMQWPLPAGLTGGRTVMLTSIVVHRDHLPGRILGAPLLPLLVAPGRTLAAMPLPAAEWSAGLRDLWRGLAG